MMLPLIADYQPDRTFAWRAGEPVSCGRALSEIHALGHELSPATPYINLCEERYCFILAFSAVALAGGVNLMPHSHTPEVLSALREAHPDALTVDDDRISQWLAAAVVGDTPELCPSLDGSRQVAVAMTSGSTGQPGRHGKRWADLVLGAKLYQQRFFAGGRRPSTVATVPPQHMYGLETSVLPALQLGFPVEAQRPFMPWSVARSLAHLPAPRLLITTPVHLRACVDAAIDMPEIARVISATAPLDRELAHSVEHAWGTEVHEIYGSTETGSIASRQTANTDVWTLYDRMHLAEIDGVHVHGPQLPDPFCLNDNVELLDSGRFRLLGRRDDMLKMGGKRLSVNELTQHLLGIDGVDDAIVFKPDEDSGSQRPAALVVAPALNEREIGAELARAVDAVFVPRPLLRVEQLPRNAMGKVPRGDLLGLLEEARLRNTNRT